MSRPRAADDFDVIRDRLEQLLREREELAETNAGEGNPAPGADDAAERRRKEHIEGAPPAWVPTIFLPQPTD